MWYLIITLFVFADNTSMVVCKPYKTKKQCEAQIIGAQMSAGKGEAIVAGCVQEHKRGIHWYE